MMPRRRRAPCSPWRPTGADIVKVGLSAAGRRDADRCSASAELDLGDVLLVGVLLADRGVDLDLVATSRALPVSPD